MNNYVATKKEEDLLKILLDPAHRTKSITDQCKLAKVSRPVYYEAMRKPEFREYLKARSLELVVAAVPATVNAFVKKAQRGSYTHGKVILEMAGLLNSKLTVEHTGEVVALTEEEKIQKKSQILEKMKG